MFAPYFSISFKRILNSHGLANLQIYFKINLQMEGIMSILIIERYPY